MRGISPKPKPFLSLFRARPRIEKAWAVARFALETAVQDRAGPFMIDDDLLCTHRQARDGISMASGHVFRLVDAKKRTSNHIDAAAEIAAR